MRLTLLARNPFTIKVRGAQPCASHRLGNSVFSQLALVCTVALSAVACGGGGGSGTGSDTGAPVALGAALPEDGHYIALEQTQLSLSEASRSGSVLVHRQSTAAGTASVGYRFVSGSATPIDDFSGEAGVLQWSAGDTSPKSIHFLVHSDLATEPVETFYIELFELNGTETLGVNDRVSINISNSDCSAILPARMAADTVLSEPCYRLQTDVAVSGSAQVSFVDGATVIADAGTGIAFTGQSSLVIEGKTLLPVVVKGAEPEPGFWGGFKLESSSALHRVEHAEISHASNAVSVLSGQLAAFDHNRISYTRAAGVSVPLDSAFVIGQNNVLTDTPGGIELVGNYIAAGETVDIPGNPAHYSLAGSLIIHGTLTLRPGTDVRMNADESIIVFQTGAINAVGTEASPIFLHGVEPKIGFWDGIQYVSSTRSENQLEFVTVANGGGDPARPGNLIVDGLHTQISLRNCTFSHSEGYGIVYSANAFQVDLQDIKFAQNQLGDQSL